MKELPILELQKMMDSGKLTSKKLVKSYLEQIEKLDKSGPKLNAVIELNPDALIIAESLDQERKTNGPRSKLHGIPSEQLNHYHAELDQLHGHFA